ncbi:MAG: ion transporter [Holosporales bacterium]|jgi:voltage-gated potassium channel
MQIARYKTLIHELYEGESRLAQRFRYGILVLDFITIVFLIVATFFHENPQVERLNIFFGVYLALDVLLRLWIAGNKTAFLLNPLTIVDVVVVLSFLPGVLGGNFAFLRSLRVLRLLHSYRVRERLCQDVPLFRRHQDITLSALNLFVFIFIMTEIVFVTQIGHNPQIRNFLDALYFTITTLTTTGFGDVTLQGNMGRGLAVVIMIFGVSLFLRLIQTILRPAKIRFMCDACGLFLHERDAVHCKHCGKVLATPSEGDV